MNALLMLHPYRWYGSWVFDDARFGLVKEPFVSGADIIIDQLTSSLRMPELGFRLTFSAGEFPGGTRLDWIGEGYGGNWYRCPAYGIDGWLCPALFHYFLTAPKHIYARADNIMSTKI